MRQGIFLGPRKHSAVTREWIKSQMNHSCHVWMSHVTWGCVTSRMNASIHRSGNGSNLRSHLNGSSHIWTSYVTYDWVISHKKESCHVRIIRITYERVKLPSRAHASNLHWTVNESGPLWIIPVTYERVVSGYECVMSHMNESCQVWMSHVTYCHVRLNQVIYECIRSHVNESCHIWMCHVTYETVM